MDGTADRTGEGGSGVKAFFQQTTVAEAPSRPLGVSISPLIEPVPQPASPAHEGRALIALYDGMTAAPRVEEVLGKDAADLIDSLSSAVYRLAHEAGGSVPYTVVREITENLLHAGFAEVVVTIMGDGHTVRFSDQGPGIADKERCFLPGFSTASTEMKRVIRGVGSGLPIVRECLGFSGGTVSIEDNLGHGTVVTVRTERPAPSAPAPERPAITPAPRLSVRQKQVLSLIMELGAAGPSVVSRELGVGLSTAYRDLASLESLDLISSDETGKRVLTDVGASVLEELFRS